MQARHLLCMYLTRVQFPTPHMVPRIHQEQYMNAEPEVILSMASCGPKPHPSFLNGH